MSQNGLNYPTKRYLKVLDKWYLINFVVYLPLLTTIVFLVWNASEQLTKNCTKPRTCILLRMNHLLTSPSTHYVKSSPFLPGWVTDF